MSASMFEPTHLLERLARPPRDVRAWLHDHIPSDGRAESSETVDAWDRWVLIALCRHSRRQALVEQVVRERLSGSIDDIACGGAFGHPTNRPSTGQVPGMPGWSYRFHGRGCCLEHTDGTILDVDFDEHGSESVDPWFFATYLATAPELGVVERRLHTSDAWKAAIQPLLDAGLLEGEHRVRVVDAAVPWCEAVSAVLDAHAQADGPTLAWLACVLGDYPWAASLLGPEPPRAITEAAAGQVAARCRSLVDRVTRRAGTHVDACVKQLAQLSHQQALALALVQLDVGRIDSVMTQCVRLLVEAERPSDAEPLLRLLGRMHGVAPPQPYLRHSITMALLKGYRADTVPAELRVRILDALTAEQRAGEGDLAFVIYLLDPSAGLRRLARGLSSEVPIARQECAAALALIGGEAIEILRGSETVEAAALLALLRGDEPEPDPEPEGVLIEWRGQWRRVFRIDELMDIHDESWAFEVAKRFWARHEELWRRWWAT